MDPKEIYSIREWAPLTDVMERIPTRIFPDKFDISITCVDALETFLALGSDVGIVFWYDRDTGAVQKLKTESTNPITCVKVVDTVEYMVAAGTSDGHVFAFQIHKQLPPDLMVMAPSSRKKTNQRFAARDLHKALICCCEWTKNGMKLYSGDRKGVIVLTEFDYQAHKCTSVEILSEAYDIVQLSVHQSYLLVSTLYRSIACYRKNNTWTITQIGTKDRKQIVDCGGTFLKHSYEKPPRLICARPNLRFILADAEGTVSKTLFYRDPVLCASTWEIPLLNPKLNSSSRAQNSGISDHEVRNFHRLYTYGGQNQLIVTHDKYRLYILNIEKLQIEAAVKGLRKVIDFCVCHKEIFILEGGRTLIRLAPEPEKPTKAALIIYNPLLPPPLPTLRSTTTMIETPIEYDAEDKEAFKADECAEQPIDFKVFVELAIESPTANQNRRLEVFNEISEMPFDENIVHQSARKMTAKSKECKTPARGGGIVEIGHAVTESKTTNKLQSSTVVTPNNKSLRKKPAKKQEKQEMNKLEITTEASPMQVSFCSTDAPSTSFNDNSKEDAFKEMDEAEEEEKEKEEDKINTLPEEKASHSSAYSPAKVELMKNASKETSKGAIKKIPKNLDIVDAKFDDATCNIISKYENFDCDNDESSISTLNFFEEEATTWDGNSKKNARRKASIKRKENKIKTPKSVNGKSMKINLSASLYPMDMLDPCPSHSPVDFNTISLDFPAFSLQRPLSPFSSIRGDYDATWSVLDSPPGWHRVPKARRTYTKRYSDSYSDDGDYKIEQCNKNGEPIDNIFNCTIIDVTECNNNNDENEMKENQFNNNNNNNNELVEAAKSDQLKEPLHIYTEEEDIIENYCSGEPIENLCQPLNIITRNLNELEISGRERDSPIEIDNFVSDISSASSPNKPDFTDSDLNDFVVL